MRVKKAEDVNERLRELGYRLTPQRQLILSALQGSDDHISAEEIYVQVHAKYPNVNISTVYRNLDLLKSLYLVTETDMGEGRVRYHFGEKGHHHHLICESCGATTEADESMFLPLKSSLFDAYGFQANISHLAIFGRCTKCRG